MEENTIIGIDNGVTGSIGIISESGYVFIPTPTKKERNYTKKKAYITRIDVVKLESLLKDYSGMVVIERPMVNPGRFKSTMSAIRALEATITVLERLGLPYEYIDSKEWQKSILPGTSGEQLKEESKWLGCKLFPNFKDQITKHGDADSLLIAQYKYENN